MTSYDLMYKHYCYQTEVLEGTTDPDSCKSGYDRWSKWCVVTEISDRYIKVELPDKTHIGAEVVSHYADYEVKNAGYWVVCADYDRDIDTYYWRSSKIKALFIEWILRFKFKGPYLIHIIHINSAV